MTLDREAILLDVRERVARATYLELDAVREDSGYADELALDSAGAVTLLIEVEERYGVQIADDEARTLTTPGDTVDLIVAKLAAVTARAG